MLPSDPPTPKKKTYLNLVGRWAVETFISPPLVERSSQQGAERYQQLAGTLPVKGSLQVEIVIWVGQCRPWNQDLNIPEMEQIAWTLHAHTHVQACICILFAFHQFQPMDFVPCVSLSGFVQSFLLQSACSSSISQHAEHNLPTRHCWWPCLCHLFSTLVTQPLVEPPPTPVHSIETNTFGAAPAVCYRCCPVGFGIRTKAWHPDT